MRLHLFISVLLVFLRLISASGQSGDLYALKDVNFYKFLYNNETYRKTVDDKGNLIISEAASVTGIFDCSHQSISNLDGIQFFTSLEHLYAYDNLLNSLPQSINNLTRLKTLHVAQNLLVNLPELSGLINLTTLNVYNNRLTALPDISSNTQLVSIKAFENQLSSFPTLTKNINLQYIDIGGNNLKQLPEFKGLFKLKALLCWKNLLTGVPDLSDLQSITFINLSNNKLVSFPEIKNSPDLDSLYLDLNQLSELPSFGSTPRLKYVKLSDNRLSFRDLTPLTTYPDAGAVFEILSMENVSIEGPSGIMGMKEVKLICNTEHTSGNIYRWFRNGTLYTTTAEPELTVDTSGTGKYSDFTVEITNQLPHLKQLTLKSATHRITSGPCLDLAGLKYTISETECIRGAEVTIQTNSFNSSNQSVIYELTGVKSGIKVSSTEPVIGSLHESEYLLSILTSSGCAAYFDRKLKINTGGCNDFVITPDNDGIDDSYFFEDQGKAEIFNSQGRLIRNLPIPALWNGEDENGKVTTGYYSVKINGEARLLYFTVFY
jgi:hypothetical protein